MTRPAVRLLILVVAYNAESTLDWVLGRIPSEVLEEYDCEVLVVDDASQDRTFELAKARAGSDSSLPLTVLRNPSNRGYGGNQKVGYAYAVEHGFDCVALIHGDGQYAPEELPRLLRPVRDGDADAVLGSRMMVPGAARGGGMPLYKYAGNRVLSWCQNRMLGTSLSEFHSGYRVYSVPTLRRLRLDDNTDGFAFDTQIILQLLTAGAVVVERPIPTYYGDEVCRVNGTLYAAQVLAATAGAVLHRSGMRPQRRLEPRDHGQERYALKLGYASSHTLALEAVPPGARVLDLGAGPGGLATHLVARGCPTTAVDLVAPASAADGVTVLVRDLDDPLDLDLTEYDCVLVLDVVEHLRDPDAFLLRLSRACAAGGPRRVVMSTPNVAFVAIRLMLLFGRFEYGPSGILDRTHTRLFTFRSFLRTLRESGFAVTAVRGIPAPFQKVVGDGRLATAAVRANLALIRLSRSLFAYQILVEAEPVTRVAAAGREPTTGRVGRPRANPTEAGVCR